MPDLAVLVGEPPVEEPISEIAEVSAVLPPAESSEFMRQREYSPFGGFGNVTKSVMLSIEAIDSKPSLSTSKPSFRAWVNDTLLGGDSSTVMSISSLSFLFRFLKKNSHHGDAGSCSGAH